MIHANQVTVEICGHKIEPFTSEEDLPDPPDNFDDWHGLLTDSERAEYTRRFDAGIANEYELIRVRVQNEYATARARREETVKLAKERAARRGRR